MGLRIYEGDALVFDGSDPTTYIVCETADDFAAALAASTTWRPDDERACETINRALLAAHAPQVIESPVWTCSDGTASYSCG